MNNNDDVVLGDANARRREDEAAAAAALVGVAHQPGPRFPNPPPRPPLPPPAGAAAVAAPVVPAAPHQQQQQFAPRAVAPAASSTTHSSSYIPRSPSDRQCLTWRRVGTADGVVPPPRSGAASVVVKGRLYIFGGYGGGTGRLDDFYSYSFETSCWEEVKVASTEKPGCRENNGVVISDASRSIYLFGGYDGGRWLNDLWRFDIDTARWTCIQESSDSGADGAGSRGDGSTSSSSVVMDSDSQVKGTGPSRRFGYVSVVHNGKFVLFGGFDGTRWLNDMYEFNFATKTWTEISARGTLPTVRSCPAWAKDDTHVYIQGGYDGVERKSDFFACDLATYTWTEMPCLGTPPSPRYFHSCCIYGHRMYLYGGYSGSERLADMYAYDFDTNHWSQIDCTGGDAPSGRSSLVAQVYENSLYVFGGYNGSNVLNDFYQFRLKPISVPPPALVNDFRRLINDPSLADVHFHVEGRDVYAHRAVLAIRSTFFNAMLCGGMRESGLGDMSSEAIPLPDVSYSVFLKVLEYLYTDTVQDVSLETGIQLLIASEQFLLDRLKALCEDCIRRDIHVDTVIHILVAAHRHNASGLKDIALEFILRHLNDPTVMTGLADLKTEPELLLEIIKRSNGGGFGAGGAGVGGGHKPYPSGSQQDYPQGPFGGGGEWDARR